MQKESQWSNILNLIMKSPFIVLVLLSVLSGSAQPPKLAEYTVGNIRLPEEMNKQVCISGMKMYKSLLYFASERCPFIIVFDPQSKQITNTINLQVPQEFEMEGMTSYQDKLYLVSEATAAVYRVNMNDGAISQVKTSVALPEKLKSGDGMEGIAANEKNNKFYLLRERNEDLTKSQVYTFNIKTSKEGVEELLFESMFELPLLNPQWRYSDICVDERNNRLICLKSFAKGKQRQQFLESISYDEKGILHPETIANIDVQHFSDMSSEYKSQDYSMNLEGVTISSAGTIYIVSDNTSGKANCSMPAKEKTVLLELKKNQ
jgi:uncharacterized protein YjiK